MSETAVPQWKQELLKRRERKFFKDENPTRSGKALKFSSSGNTNSSVQENERKSEISRLDSVPYTNKVTGYIKNRIGEYQGISDKVDGSATRQVPESNEHNLKSHFVSNVKRSNETHSKGQNTTGKYEQNRLVHASDIPTGNRVENEEVSRLGRESCANSVGSSIHLDENERERLKAIIAGDGGVNDEHIRPRALKKMWKRQESKEVLFSESPTTRPTQANKKVSPINNTERTWLHKKESPANHIENTANITLSNKQSVAKKETATTKHSIEHPGASHGQVPKAYKSPYAKQGWDRPVGISHGKLSPEGESLSNGFSYTTRGSKHEPVLVENLEIVEGPQANRSVPVQEVNDVKVENEHIPSVKSLLGLFGGKSAEGKKGELVQIKKTNKLEASTKDHITPKSNFPRPGNLVRHHSEPSLNKSPSYETSDSLQTKHAVTPHSKIESKIESVNEVGLSSHQVCSGIQERVTLLRKRSLSSSTMDDIENSSEATSSEKIYQDTSAINNMQINSKQRIETKKNDIILKEDINLINQKLSNKFQKKDHKLNIDDEKVEKSFIRKTSVKTENVEKLYNSGDNKLTAKINHPVEPQLSQNMELVQGEQAEIPEHESFDKLLSVFGPKSGGKKSIVNDDKPTKSSGKIISKQDNYVVEVDQSQCKEVDQVVSTSYSNGISQNQQENKILIKNKSVESEVKIERKPRKSCLNVVDPTELLQLTKDPVLTKGKLTNIDVNQPKESETKQKPVDKIIKCEPDKRDQIAQINRAWDLGNAGTQPDKTKQEAMAVKISIPNTSQAKPQPSKAIPVTSIDTIPVSSIDSVQENNSKLTDKSDVDATGTKINNTIIHNGTTPQSTNSTNITEEDEFIPVSSIDDDSTLPPPPEIVHDKHPDNVKPCLSKNKTEKNTNVSFFQHVFIHDYQSESAATSDWDFENGEAFSSYKPSAVRQYSEMTDLPDRTPAPPVSSIDIPDGEESKNAEPTITYNEEDSVGFSESYDTTAGAMLF